MKSTRKGMTTLEITVALAIAGLFASMAVANMDSVKRKRSERDALREISAQALQARAGARTTQYPVRLAVRPDAKGTGKTLRWEQLDCADVGGYWGNSCPSQACQSNACGVGGCKCVAMGEPVPMPSTLDVSSLDGLCWMGQGAAPRARAGSRTCVRNTDPPQVPYKIKQQATGKLDHVFDVNGLTGQGRMVDCTARPVDPLCSL